VRVDDVPEQQLGPARDDLRLHSLIPSASWREFMPGRRNYIGYTSLVRASIVRIGNSRGLRIPKALLEQCGIGDAVDLTVEDGRLVVRPLGTARTGWAEAAAEMAAHGDDQLLDPEIPTTFDDTEWSW